MIYTQGITIDGEYYDVPLTKMKRTADVLDKYAKRVESGDLKREVLGVYYNYQLEFGDIEDEELYDRLFEHLTRELPARGGVTSFRGYISSVSDEVKTIRRYGEVYYTSLTAKFTSKKPTRTP